MISIAERGSAVVGAVGDCSVLPRSLDAIDAIEGIDVEAVAPEEARKRVERGGIDCLVAAGREGVELFESVREVALDLPFFLVVPDSDEGVVDRAIEAGVTDCIDPREDDRWAPIVAGRIETAVSRSRQRSELERYRLMVETVPDGIYHLDEDLVYRFVNRSMGELLGYSRERLEESHVSLVNDEEAVERAEEARERALSREDPIEVVSNEHITADGERIPCEVQFRAVVEDGEFRGTVGMVRDVSERVERERELGRQNERLQEFASIVSHDLRSPLNVALGNLALAQEGETDALGEVEYALGRMDALIDDLLTLARQGRTIDEPKPVELADVVEDAVLATETERVTVAVDSTLEGRQVSGDPGRLRELFENLLRNAIDHGGEGVSIRIGATEAGFYVEDDGPGIPETERDRAFEVGYTTADDGTGFGLNIVREIVEAHGWSVEAVEGREGGARFEVRTD